MIIYSLHLRQAVLGAFYARASLLLYRHYDILRVPARYHMH